MPLVGERRAVARRPVSVSVGLVAATPHRIAAHRLPQPPSERAAKKPEARAGVAPGLRMWPDLTEGARAAPRLHFTQPHSGAASQILRRCGCARPHAGRSEATCQAHSANFASSSSSQPTHTACARRRRSRSACFGKPCGALRQLATALQLISNALAR